MTKVMQTLQITNLTGQAEMLKEWFGMSSIENKGFFCLDKIQGAPKKM